MKDPLTYRLNDAAKCLNVSRRTINRYIEKKELAVVRLGGRTLILHDDLMAYLMRHRIAAKDEK